MKILAADTSTSINTVALCDDERIVAETIVDCGRLHSERLLATVDWVLAEAGIGIDQVDALAISIGPGSFTGVRVGVATWKGLALGKNLPLVPVPTLDAMTRLGAFSNGLVCPLLDARMKEVFGAVYRFASATRTKLSEDLVCPIDALLDRLLPSDGNGGDGTAPAIFLGDGATLYRESILSRFPNAVFVSGVCGVPRASAVAAEACTRIAQGVCADPALVTPVYLRESQAEQNRARRRAQAT
jgi:tRNA threonylcarbamoyladenosine biosynthesis protein TsaB